MRYLGAQVASGCALCLEWGLRGLGWGDERGVGGEGEREGVGCGGRGGLGSVGDGVCVCVCGRGVGDVVYRLLASSENVHLSTDAVAAAAGATAAAGHNPRAPKAGPASSSQSAQQQPPTFRLHMHTHARYNNRRSPRLYARNCNQIGRDRALGRAARGSRGRDC